VANVSAKKKRKAIMLGVGLDSDGHRRLTTGPNFALVGGSKDTHEQMTEKAVKIMRSSRIAGNNCTKSATRNLTILRTRSA